jgi:hypothetical protein
MPGQPAWSHSDPVAVAALARPSSPFGAMITITTASTGHCADLGRLLCDQEPQWPPTSEGERCLLNELAACPVIAGIGPKTPGPSCCCPARLYRPAAPLPPVLAPHAWVMESRRVEIWARWGGRRAGYR